MTIKYVNYISGVFEFKFVKDGLYLINTDNHCLYRYDTKNFKKLWKSDYEVSQIFSFNDKLYSFGLDEFDLNGNSRRLENTITYLSEKHGENFELERISNNGLFLIVTWIGDLSTYHIYDLENKTFIKENIELNYYARYFDEKIVVCVSYSFLRIYNYRDSAFILEKDFSEEIVNIYIYQEKKVIVATKHSSLYCYDLYSGEKTWGLSSNAESIQLVGHNAYIYNDLSLYKVDLKTGKKKGCGLENDLLPNFIYNNEEYRPYSSKMVFYNGLLWHLVFSKKEAFIIAIKPDTGNYELIHQLGINEEITDIKFNMDRMYLLDSNNTLHTFYLNS